MAVSDVIDNPMITLYETLRDHGVSNFIFRAYLFTTKLSDPFGLSPATDLLCPHSASAAFVSYSFMTNVSTLLLVNPELFLAFCSSEPKKISTIQAMQLPVFFK